MSIEHHYQNPTTGATIFDLVVDQVRLGGEGLSVDGQMGAVATAIANIDDRDGTTDFLPLQRWYVRETAGPSHLVLTGTLDRTTGDRAIVGHGTAFTTELSRGDELVFPDGPEYLTVDTITDDTHLTVYIAPTSTVAGAAADRGAQQRLWSGWTGDPSEDRSIDEQGGGEFIDAGRVHHVELAEGNTLLQHRQFIDAAANRKHTETTGVRLAALLGVPEVSGRLFDDGLVTYGTKTVDPADYSGEVTSAALNDLAQVDGFGFSCDYHEAADHWQLVYQDPVNAFFLPSPLRLSNYDEDDGAELTYHAAEAKRTRQSAGIGAGVSVQGALKKVRRTRAATADVYEFRDLQAISLKRKKTAQLNAYADRYLVDAAAPHELIAIPSVIIAAKDMHLVRRLRQIQVRFEHLSGWTAWRWARIWRMDPNHAVGDNGEPSADFYDVGLVLGPAPDQPPPPTYTFAVLDRGYVDSAGPIDSPGIGDYEMGYSGTGDAPPSSSHYGPQPKSGLVDYLYRAGVPIGFKALGGGPLTVHAQTHPALGYIGTGQTVAMKVLINGVMALSTPVYTDGGSGPHVWGPEMAIDDDIVVVTDDEITTEFEIGGHGSAIGGVPIAGTFAPPYQFSVTGLLS